jgi:hypothetical protein
MAFQFEAVVFVRLNDNRVIDFEFTNCKLICRKDTGSLIEATILPRLTRGLENIATKALHIYTRINNRDAEVMNNATYLFDKFATILKEGKKVDCQFEDADIDILCGQFKAVLLLWDGAFSLARTHHPVEANIAAFQSHVTAAGH